MAPAQIEDIISKPQEDHAADGKEGTYQGHKLGEKWARNDSNLLLLCLSRIPVFSIFFFFQGWGLNPGPCTYSHTGKALYHQAISQIQKTPTQVPGPSQPTNNFPTSALTSWWGNALHCSSTKQFRKGKGMKQKRMIRKTAPLITPWDSGLRPSGKGWRRKKKGAWSLSIVGVPVD